MSQVVLARATMGMSLGFHIVFAVLGVGLPALMAIAEGLWLWKRDVAWLTLAKRWSRAFAIIFAVGAVSGTALSFELGLLWPRFMALSGSAIGLPFTAEGFAFFLEAIFLGLYLYGWDRLSPVQHWLCSIPVAVSGALSSIFVVMVNAWMNTPTGFTLTNGVLTSVDPVAAALSPAQATEDIHMLVSAYVVSGFVVAAVYAAGILRRREDSVRRRGLMLGMSMAAVAIVLAGITGDSSARFVYNVEPIKFAAQEGLFTTTSGAPIHILGIPDASTKQVLYGIEIPYALSLLAAFNPNAVVQGLNTVPPNLQPNPVIVHLSFDTMVGFGTLIGLVAAAFWLLTIKRRALPTSARPLLWLIVATGPASVLAMEGGWFVTEFGRQPWVVRNILLTSQAATTAPGVGVTLAVFVAIYLLLALTLVRLLLRFAREPGPR